jgi:hypothetical protein
VEEIQEFLGSTLGTAVLAFAAAVLAAILASAGAVVAAVLALGGVLVSGLLEGRRRGQAFRREKGWELNQFRLQRLEEISTLASAIHSATWKADNTLSQICADEELSQPRADRLVLHVLEEQLESVLAAIQRLEMLGEYYAPQLSAEIAALRQSWQGTHNTQTRLLAIGAEGAVGLFEWIELIGKDLCLIMANSQQLRKAAGAIVRRYLDWGRFGANRAIVGEELRERSSRVVRLRKEESDV